MSTGGLFNLIANDGKADRMILATELIQKRICDIRCYKRKQGFKNTDPTLNELEKTHILFINAHYKPFIATSFEYLRESIAHGNTRWGSELKFSIPQAGDFFHDMVLHMQTDKLEGSAGLVPDFPTLPDDPDSDTYGTQLSTSTSSSSAVVSYGSQESPGPVVRFTYSYVDSEGATQDVGDSVKPFVRWVEWPGIRAVKRVEFEINSTKLDEYTSDTLLFHKTYNLPINKQEGFKKLMGQDIGYDAISDYTSIKDSSAFHGDLSGFESNGEATEGMAHPAAHTSYMSSRIYVGNQTPALEKDGLDVWYPLLFWFSKSVTLAIPSVSIPYGQRFIKVFLEDFDKVATTAPGNLYLQTKVESMTTSDGDLTGSSTVTDYKCAIKKTPITPSNASVSTSSGTISDANLWINHIYVLPEVHDIFIKRIGFSLIRIYKLQSDDLTSSNSSGDSIGRELNSLKFPIETLYFAFRPDENRDTSNEDYWKAWHKFTKLEKNKVDTVSDSEALVGDAHDQVAKVQSQVQSYSYWKEEPTVTKIGLNSHGIQIFQRIDEKFWNAYIPYHFGGFSVNTPEETGAYMITFCLYPGNYQPSGHLNFSRAKNTYLQYVSNYISSSNPVKMIVVAIAINFLIISDGSAVLRYST